MVEEKHATFVKLYGFPSDALPSIDFIDLHSLQTLQKDLKIEWRIFRP